MAGVGVIPGKELWLLHPVSASRASIRRHTPHFDGMYVDNSLATTSSGLRINEGPILGGSNNSLQCSTLVACVRRCKEKRGFLIKSVPFRELAALFSGRTRESCRPYQLSVVGCRWSIEGKRPTPPKESGMGHPRRRGADTVIESAWLRFDHRDQRHQLQVNHQLHAAIELVEEGFVLGRAHL